MVFIVLLSALDLEFNRLWKLDRGSENVQNHYFRDTFLFYRETRWNFKEFVKFLNDYIYSVFPSRTLYKFAVELRIII
jgi:hypothetical protein